MYGYRSPEREAIASKRRVETEALWRSIAEAREKQERRLDRWVLVVALLLTVPMLLRVIASLVGHLQP
jgi:hypothetical protein